MSDVYVERSYGSEIIGFGEKPGIVVVDYQLGFTDPAYPLGGAPLIERGVQNSERLLDVARRAGVPVAVCNTAYLNEREMPYWKVGAVQSLQSIQTTAIFWRSSARRRLIQTCSRLV